MARELEGSATEKGLLHHFDLEEGALSRGERVAGSYANSTNLFTGLASKVPMVPVLLK